MIDTANRRKLINEVLNYDKEIDQRVLNLEKQQVKKWGVEDIQPFIQVDKDVVTAAKETVANLKVLLDQKLAGFNDHKLKSATVEDVIKLYNELAVLFIKPSNTNATKIAVRNLANSLESLIEAILISLGDWGRISTPPEPLRKAYKLYDVIRDQLRSGNIKPITADDFIARIESRPPSASVRVARSVTEFHRTPDDDDENDDDDPDEGRPHDRQSDILPTSLPAEVVEPAEVEEPPEPELSSSAEPAEPKSKVAKMYAKEFLPPTPKNIAKMITKSTSPKLLSSSLTEEQFVIISKAITPVSRELAKSQQLEHYTHEQLESTVTRMSIILNASLTALANPATLTFIRDSNINLIGIAAECAEAIGNRIDRTFESMVEEPTSSSSSSIVTIPDYRIDRKSVITAATRAFAQAACERANIDVMEKMTVTQLAESVFDAGLQAACEKADDMALSLNYDRKYTQTIIYSELKTMSRYVIDAVTLALVQYMSSVTTSQQEPEIDITYNPVQLQAKSASSGSQSKAKSALVPIIKSKLHKYIPLTSKHPPPKAHSTPFPKSGSIKWIPGKGVPKWIKAIPSKPPPKASEEAGSGKQSRAKKLVSGTGGTINDSDVEKKPKSTTGRKKKVVTSIPVHTPDLNYNPDLNDVYFVR